MKNISYSKSGAIVSVSLDDDTQTYNIKKGEQILDISFSRRQKTEKREGSVPMGHIKVSAIVGEHIALYDVGVSIDDEKRSFSASLVADKFYTTERVPEYEVDFEKGIPAREYGKLCKELYKQNAAVGQIMKNYVLTDTELQRYLDDEKLQNGILNKSVFNNKLDDFLSL